MKKPMQGLLIEKKIFPLVSEKTCFTAWRTLINLARASGDAVAFTKDFAKNYPLPDLITHKYLGMSADQISAFGSSSVLELGGHTHSHPYLDQIPFDQQLDEMQKNKHILEEISNSKVRYFAYTGGEYDAHSLEAVKRVGFEAAFAVQPKNLGPDYQYEIPRMDIYSPSLLKLMLKVSGLVDLARKIGLRGN